MIELYGIKDALVGFPGLSGISNEQRKRLTIAVELVSNPSVLFMDEPTSGLDARAAAIIMRVVKNIVNTRRTVVCTIHQPSVHIFEAFDKVINECKSTQRILRRTIIMHSKTITTSKHHSLSNAYISMQNIICYMSESKRLHLMNDHKN